MSRTRTTQILRKAGGGDHDALDELFPLVFDQLRQLAAASFRRQPRGHTLQPTALVHEAYLRLVDTEGLRWNDRVHFLAIAARAMHQALVDYARYRGAQKRGAGWRRVTLGGGLAGGAEHRGVDVLSLEEALSELGRLHERQARVVELRFFGGLTFAEAAVVLGVSAKTVEGDWYGARAWLRSKLDPQRGE